MFVYAFIFILSGVVAFLSSEKKISIFIMTLVAAIFTFEVSQYLLLTPETFFGMFNRLFLIAIVIALIVGAVHLLSNNELFEEKSVIVAFSVAVLLFLSMLVISLFSFGSASTKFEQVNVSEVKEELPAFDENSNPISVPMTFAKNKMRKSFGQVPNSSYYELGTPQIQLLNNEMVYVAPVEFTGFSRWYKQRLTPGYFVLSATDSSANPKFVKNEVSYTPSSFFSKNAERAIFKKHPDLVRYGGLQFEVDDKGNSYFLQTYGDYMVAKSGFVPKGILLLDAKTGKVEKFALKDVPKWIDAPISSKSVKLHNTIFGEYPHGLLNAFFAQQDVIIPTLTGNENGVTPVFFENEMHYFADFQSPKEGIDSMMGYSLTNARTGEMTYYSGSETSFMDSNGAQAVANKKFVEKQWESSVPILYNFFGETTWFVSMTDQNGFLQQIAVVSAENPEIFASSTSTKDALKKYKSALSGNVNQSINGDSKAEKKAETITISRTYKEKVGDQTVVYILDTQQRMFVVSSELDPKTLFLQEGDTLAIDFNENDSGILPIVSVKLNY